MLNSRVAGACDTASIPKEIRVGDFNGSFTASSHNLLGVS